MCLFFSTEVNDIHGFQDILPRMDLIKTEYLPLEQAKQSYYNRHRDLRHHISQAELGDVVILASVTFEFHSLFDNWFLSVKRLGLVYNIILMCEDEKAYKHYSKSQNDNFKVVNALDIQMYGLLQRNMTGTFKLVIRRRTVYVRNVLFSGVDVLLVDVDAVWLKDPLEVIRHNYKSYDMWMAQGYDSRRPCPCFLYIKAVPQNMELVDKWVHQLATTPKRPNQVYEQGDGLALERVVELEWTEKNVKIFPLDKVHFPTGKEYFDPEWNKLHSVYVYIAHGNHLGREENKIAKLKEFGLWLLDD